MIAEINILKVQVMEGREGQIPCQETSLYLEELNWEKRVPLARMRACDQKQVPFRGANAAKEAASGRLESV